MPTVMQKILQGMLEGDAAFVKTLQAVQDLTAAQVRRRPHPKLPTIWEHVGHVVYWQDWFLCHARKRRAAFPKSYVEGWPSMPPVRGQVTAWADLLARLDKGLKAADRVARTKDPEAVAVPKPEWRYGRILTSLANHNAYHTGQIVALRKMIGIWPPPKGGMTW